MQVVHLEQKLYSTGNSLVTSPKKKGGQRSILKYSEDMQEYMHLSLRHPHGTKSANREAASRVTTGRVGVCTLTGCYRVRVPFLYFTY